jgi:hypothetical protein
MSAHDLVTSAIILGAMAFIARNYTDQRKVTRMEQGGHKYDIIMQPLDTPMITPTNQAKKHEPVLIAKGAAGNSEDAKTETFTSARKDVESYNWWTVTNELVNQIAPEYDLTGENDPLHITLQPQPLYLGDRRNFYDPVNRRV